MGALASYASGKKGQAVAIVEVLGASGGIAYANHRYGAGEMKLGSAADGTGGVPLDGALGLAGIAFAFFKPSSKFSHHALHLGLGAGAGFMYRVGAAKGDAAAQTAAAAAHTTAGQSALVASRPVPQLSAAFAQYSTNQRRAIHAVR